MTNIVINKVKTIKRNINGLDNISFDYIGEKVHSAEQMQRIMGVFVSQPIIATSSLISWKDATWDVTSVDGTDVSIYIKAAFTEDGLANAEWTGPYFSSGEDETLGSDLSNLKGRYLQFIIVLSSDIGVEVTPIFNSLSLSYLSADTAVKFYTKAFNLGFVPKHVLLTYNGKKSDDAIIRFSISGFDSIDSNDYQYIDPNKIEELSELSILSDKIKVFVELIGDAGVPLELSEFALMFSGDEQLRLNNVSSSSS